MKGVVYKLYHSNYPEFYIGSSKIFEKRKNDHKYNSNNETSVAYHFKVYKYIREHGGYDSWKYEILEKEYYKNKKHRFERERYFIESLKPTLNTTIPGRTDQEWYEDNKEMVKVNRKKYYNEHKVEISNKSSEFYQKHKVKIIKEQKKYYEEHIQEVKAYKTKKVECKYCKRLVSNSNHAAHRKTDYCILTRMTDFINNL